MAFFDTPRVRRLKADVEAMRLLREHSSIIDYQSFGDPPERYMVTFKGKGLHRKSEADPVEVAEVHRVEIRLGIDYPRSRPDLQWLTAIYHPNISAVGAVCLGGYSTNWVPSLGLAELCEMLWDMVRYANFDPKSAYNYAAGRWSEAQAQFDLPVDVRNLRDRMTKTIGDNVIRFSDPAAARAAAAPAPLREAPPIVKPPEEDILIITDDAPVRPSLPQFRPEPRPRLSDDDVLIIE